jgi:hypothetical protein
MTLWLRSSCVASCGLLLVATVAERLEEASRPPLAIEPAREPTCPQCGGKHFVRLELTPATEEPDTS